MPPVNTRIPPRRATLIGSGVEFNVVLALKFTSAPAPRVKVISSSRAYGADSDAIVPVVLLSNEPVAVMEGVWSGA